MRSTGGVKHYITILFVLSCVLFPARLRSATILSKRISITASNLPISTILKLIEQQAQVRFMYNTKLLDNKKTVSISVKNTPVKQILKIIINDKDIVFYELNKYIVIAKPREVPQGTIFERAIVTDNVDNNNRDDRKTVYDTVLVYDTLTVADTTRIEVYDTVIVYDTVKIKQAAVTNQAAKEKQSYGICAEFIPSFQLLLDNSKDKGQPSVSANILLQKNFGSVSLGIGVGIFVQRGTSSTTIETSTLDSSYHEASNTETHRYKTGDYYYIKDGQTIHEELYDSVTVTVPYNWYSYSKTDSKSEQKSLYSITWMTIPIRMVYATSSKKSINGGIALTLSPAMALHRSGDMNFSSTNTSKSLSKSDISAYALFASLSPFISYNFARSFSLYLSPTFQASATKIVAGEKYTSISAGVMVGASVGL